MTQMLKAWRVYSWMPYGSTRTRTTYTRAQLMAENKKEAAARFLSLYPAEAGRRISIAPVKRIS